MGAAGGGPRHDPRYARGGRDFVWRFTLAADFELYFLFLFSAAGSPRLGADGSG